MFDLTNPIYMNEDAARAHLERIRWSGGMNCPCCGGVNRIAPVAMKNKVSAKNPEGTEAKGYYHCGDCRRKFTVRTGTVYERSHIPLHKWVLATHLLCASKKGMSAHQLHRMIGVTYKSAWFMAHRIREAMIETDRLPMGGEGASVQTDETYIGKKESEAPVVNTRGGAFTKRGKGGPSHKRAVVGLISGGKSRTFHVDRADAETIREILVNNVDMQTALHTDESPLYKTIGKEFADHKTVKHSIKEWVRDGAHTNTIESYFSVFKRGMKGVYQHCSEKHLQRYLNEFDFRYNSRDVSDFERATEAHKGAEGKRLTFRRTKKQLWTSQEAEEVGGWLPA